MKRIVLIAAILLVLLVSCANTRVVDSSDDAQTGMRISVTDGSNTIIFTLNDSSASRSLYEMLPLEVPVGDFLYNEKIFYPPESLDVSDPVVGDGDAGDLAYFHPWGDVVMYIGPFRSSTGLYLLGTAESGADRIGNLSGTILVQKL